MALDIYPYLLARRYTDLQIQEHVGEAGKSAYEIAVQHGFVGTEEEWLQSLVPQIGPNGHWFIENIDTGVIASPDLSGYYSAANLTALSTKEILDICK